MTTYKVNFEHFNSDGLIFKAWFNGNFPDGITVKTDGTGTLLGVECDYPGLLAAGVSATMNEDIYNSFKNRQFNERVWMDHANTMLELFDIAPADDILELADLFEEGVLEGWIPSDIEGP